MSCEGMKGERRTSSCGSALYVQLVGANTVIYRDLAHNARGFLWRMHVRTASKEGRLARWWPARPL